MNDDCVLCRWLRHPWVVLFLGLLAALLLYFLPRWAWWFFLIYILALVVIGLLALAFVIARIVRRLCWKWKADPKGSGSVGHPTPKSINLPPSIYKRPDPLIYSQTWMASKGLAVTWDNPDIVIAHTDGTPGLVKEDDLVGGTTYQIRAAIWNGSSDAPAVGMKVLFSYLSFGIGAKKNFIGQTFIDVAVKGSPALPAVATMDWTPPVGGGHFCLLVELVWGDDADPGNNVGQNNVSVKKLNSPNASFLINVGNQGTTTAAMEYRMDSYRLLPIESCSVVGQGRERRARIGLHRIGAQPVPEGWTVTLEESAHAPLRPGETRDVTVKIVAVDGFEGEMDINLNGFLDGELAGGVTMRVHS